MFNGSMETDWKNDYADFYQNATMSLSVSHLYLLLLI